ncbi:GDSL-type esterase/lipase family protein [Modestobacter sp. SYSU DS0875]
MTVVAALGDSLTCGEGVGLRIEPEATWVGLVAAALPGARLVPLAVAGARVADVRDRQLPLLEDEVPGELDLATVLVGLNDVARSGFDPGAVGAGLLGIVAALRARRAEVLVGRLHDPAAVLRLPGPVARAARRRTAVVNAAVDAAAGLPGVYRVDLAAVPVLTGAAGWAADRVHPSRAGHRGLAVAATGVLRAAGWAPQPVGEPPPGRGPTGADRAWWAVRHGLPYAVGHVRELGGPVASAVLRCG